MADGAYPSALRLRRMTQGMLRLSVRDLEQKESSWMPDWLLHGIRQNINVFLCLPQCRADAPQVGLDYFRK